MACAAGVAACVAPAEPMGEHITLPMPVGGLTLHDSFSVAVWGVALTHVQVKMLHERTKDAPPQTIEGLRSVCNGTYQDAGDGWHLVFNEMADIWGTQHSSENDVAEIPLDHSMGEEPSEKLAIEITAVADGGLLELMWGKHQWTTTFEIVD